MILTPQFVDRTTLQPAGAGNVPEHLPVIEMNETMNRPRGIVAEQFSLRAVWRADTAALTRISFAGSDGIGQIVKCFYAVPDEAAHKTKWQHRCDTYRERVDLQEFDAPDTQAFFYDELPLRVRTLDFTHAAGERELRLLTSVAHPERGPSEFKPAKISWKAGDRTTEVDLTHEGGRDHFTLDADFPFLLRRWDMADGTRLTMKNSLRINYADYLKEGDRERALKDPMLRHPD